MFEPEYTFSHLVKYYNGTISQLLLVKTNHFSFQDDIYTNGTTSGPVDAIFKKVPKNATGFHIWKIDVRRTLLILCIEITCSSFYRFILYCRI